jgi:hypothetical protein
MPPSCQPHHHHQITKLSHSINAIGPVVVANLWQAMSTQRRRLLLNTVHSCDNMMLFPDSGHDSQWVRPW